MAVAAKNKVFSIQLIFTAFLLLYSLIPSKLYCYSIQNITQTQSLSQGNTLVSPSHAFELGFFSPNKTTNQYVGIWYTGISPRTVVWVANRGNPINETNSPASLAITSRGEIKIIDRHNNSVWSSSTNTNLPSDQTSVFAVLSDNGNLLLKQGTSDGDLWDSFEVHSDTLLPGSTLVLDAAKNKTRVLTSWRSESDPSAGDFVVGLVPRMPPEAHMWRASGGGPNGIVLWRSGPWDKSRFTGIPDMETEYRSDFDLVEEPQRGTTEFRFSPYQDSITNMFLSPEGVLRMRTVGEDGKLFSYWWAPRNACDVYGACGPFGVCDDQRVPICRCLKGFVPRSNREWLSGNWSQGCVRRKELLCGENGTVTDVFGKIGEAKIPDFYEFMETGGPVFCRTLCLRNCSCLAYAYVEGIGCLVWSKELVDIQVFSELGGGVELFFRLAHGELAGGSKTVVTVGISVAAIVSGGIIMGIIAFNLRRRGARKRENMLKQNERVADTAEATDSGTFQVKKQQDLTELPVIDFTTILAVTNHFSPTNKLGQGGFGSVYKGTMPDGNEIAVKRLSSTSGQGAEEFKNEILLIAKLQHRNLVRLYGYCVENEEKLLVYEFMPNKSLDCFIFDPPRGTFLNWATRWNIIHGIARGLVYLHRDSCLRVIHRDLKVSNILLDEKMNPKISDFGLARIFQGTLDLANTQRVVGTLGYMSPEYAMGGIFSEKSDVFSFGVLILEILSGKKNSTFPYLYQHLSLITYAWELWSENRELELVDSALSESWSNSEVRRCIHIGLLCVQDHASDRPTMPDVVQMLSNEISLPRPREPMFALQSSPKFDTYSQSGTVNEASMSLVEAR